MPANETSLGAVIKNARLKKGLTQENLAERVGIGSRHMMSIENEGGFPSYNVLRNLVRELDIPTDIIFYPEKDSGDMRLDYLSRMLSKCDDHEIRAVTALVEALLSER